MKYKNLEEKELELRCQIHNAIESFVEEVGLLPNVEVEYQNITVVGKTQNKILKVTVRSYLRGRIE